jgi:hypothetical protein
LESQGKVDSGLKMILKGLRDLSGLLISIWIKYLKTAEMRGILKDENFFGTRYVVGDSVKINHISSC